MCWLLSNVATLFLPFFDDVNVKKKVCPSVVVFSATVWQFVVGDSAARRVCMCVFFRPRSSPLLRDPYETATVFVATSNVLPDGRAGEGLFAKVGDHGLVCVFLRTSVCVFFFFLSSCSMRGRVYEEALHPAAALQQRLL